MMGRLVTERAAYVLAVLLGLVLVLLHEANEGLLEMGDGIQHYQIARFSWRHPELFLDLWGKPLFTLLASPFAQFGHTGVAVFNAVVAVVTGALGVRALRHAGGGAQLVFPALVLLAPQYVLMVMAGMTEPLFGLVTVLVVLLLLIDRSVAAAIVASLTPFARPEYIVFLPMVMAWLAFRRQWRVLPWCLAGPVLYALLATVVHGDPLWFWSHDPYGYSGDLYGKGPLDHFVSRAETIYGRPLLTLGLSALAVWPVVYWKDKEERRAHRLMLLTAAVPVIAIMVVHSVLWWKGWRGSAGLVRTLVTSVPLAALFATFTLGRGSLLLLHAPRARWAAGVVLVPVLVWWAQSDLVLQVQLPVKQEMNQRFLDAAAFGVKKHMREGARLYSTIPFMAYRAELDPFDTTVYIPLWGLTDEEADRHLRPGDMLAWDSQIGSNEAGISLNRLLNDERFTVLETVEPPEGSRVLGGHVYEIFLFERRDAIRSFTVDTLIWNGEVRSVPAMRMDTVPCSKTDEHAWCMKAGEFSLEITKLPLPSEGCIYDEWIVSGNASVEEASRLVVVYAQRLNGEGVRYDQEDVVNGPFVFNRRVPPVTPGTEQVIYFWNLGKKPFSLQGFTLLRKRWTQRTK